MKKLVWTIGATVATVILLGGGFLTGRLFPAHHYQRYGESQYLYDTATGHVCAVFPETSSPTTSWDSPLLPPNAKQVDPAKSSSEFFDQLASGQKSIPLCNSK